MTDLGKSYVWYSALFTGFLLTTLLPSVPFFPSFLAEFNLPYLELQLLRCVGSIIVIGGCLINQAAKNELLGQRGLATSGIYQYSRNPLYVSDLMLLFGAAILTNSMYMVALVVPVFLYFTMVLVPREERYLQSVFEEDYRRYGNRVARWAGKR
eukprot:TRINITY_DN13854_c0_g1_i1.p1 TRINITY_DN13854_c0_g1~~TRINITY_DN13854_c0_g1_i1.p1  ORF type:complete len:154 (-),score=14.71 TRINITY_DN13854_c0_g1_i1:53-514(-)